MNLLKEKLVWGVIASLFLALTATTAFAADVEVRLKTNDGSTGFVVKDLTSQEVMRIDSLGKLRLLPVTFPTTGTVGAIAIDASAGNVLKWYDGTTWRAAGAGSIEVDNLTIGYFGTSLEVKDLGITAGKLATAGLPGANQILTYTGTGLAWTTMASVSSVEVDNISISKNLAGSLEVKDFGIITTKIASNAVVTIHISDEAVTNSKLAFASVTADKLATLVSPASNEVLSWNGTQLIWKSISAAASIEPDYITIGKNINGSFEVMNLGISATQIATGAVTTDKIAASLPVTTGEVLSWNGTSLAWQTPAVAASTEVDNLTIGRNVNSSLEVKDASLLPTKLLATMAPATGEVLGWNATTGAFEWKTIASLASTEPDYITIGKNINGSFEVMNSGISATQIATGAVSADKILTALPPVSSGEVLVWLGDHLAWTQIPFDYVTIGSNVTGSFEVLNNSLLPAKLSALNGPATGEVLGWNETTGQFEWKTLASIASVEPDNITISRNINGSLEVKDAGITAAKLYSINVPVSNEVLAYNWSTGQFEWRNMALPVDNVTTTLDINGSIEVKDAGLLPGKLSVTMAPATGEVLGWNDTTGQFEWKTIASLASTEPDNITIGRNVNSSLEVKDASLLPTKLLATMAPATGEVLGWNATTGAFEWKTIASLASSEPDYLTIGKNINGSLEVMAYGVTGTQIATNAVTSDKLFTLLAPATGEVLSWNGTAMMWQSASAAASLEPDYITISKNINGSLEVMDPWD